MYFSPLLFYEFQYAFQNHDLETQNENECNNAEFYFFQYKSLYKNLSHKQKVYLNFERIQMTIFDYIYINLLKYI